MRATLGSSQPRYSFQTLLYVSLLYRSTSPAPNSALAEIKWGLQEDAKEAAQLQAIAWVMSRGRGAAGIGGDLVLPSA